jgi:hypothetical protein
MTSGISGSAPQQRDTDVRLGSCAFIAHAGHGRVFFARSKLCALSWPKLMRAASPATAATTAPDPSNKRAGERAIATMAHRGAREGKTTHHTAITRTLSPRLSVVRMSTKTLRSTARSSGAARGGGQARAKKQCAVWAVSTHEMTSTARNTQCPTTVEHLKQRELRTGQRAR